LLQLVSLALSVLTAQAVLLCLLAAAAAVACLAGTKHYRCSNTGCATVATQLGAEQIDPKDTSGASWLPEHMFSTAQKGKTAASMRCIPCVQQSLDGASAP
jgi:cytochrome c-type biogenesis protein CcmH/NrfF